MLTLGFDTSNYATSLAVFDTDAKEVVCAKKKFLPVKEGPARPAAKLRRCFTTRLRCPACCKSWRAKHRLPVWRQLVFQKAAPGRGPVYAVLSGGRQCGQCGCVCASAYPWCAPRTSRACGRRAVRQRPVAIVWHFRACVFTSRAAQPTFFFAMALRCSRHFGTSLDLYAGQAVDRIGVKLGFPVSGRRTSLPTGGRVPAAAPCESGFKGMNCHLSGLENQCSALLDKGYPPAYVAKYCLHCGETVFRMVEAAYAAGFRLPVVWAGGVMSSQIVRDYVTARLRDVCFVPGSLPATTPLALPSLPQKRWAHGQCD